MSLCQHKDIFGKPGEGVHSIRIGGIAAVDMGLTVGAAYIIAKSYNKKICNNIYVSFAIVLFILLIISVITHKLFCVETAVIKYICK